MKVGDLVIFKGEKRTGVILREHVISRCGKKEYNVRWFPRGYSREMAESIELLRKEDDRFAADNN